MMRSHTMLKVIIACVIASSLSTRDVRSGEDEASRLFREGRTAMKAEDYATAAERLAESHKLDPSPGTLLNLAICEEKLGKLVAARNHLRAVLEMLRKDDPRRPIAQQQLDSIDERVPSLTLRLDDDASENTEVRLDGHAVGAPDLGTPIALDPGSHEIEVSSEEGSKRLSIQVVEGEAKELRLGGQDDATEVGQLKPDSGLQTGVPHAAGSNTGAYIMLGVGAVGVATGSYLWMELNKRQDTIDNNCDAAKQCNERGMSAVDEGNSLMPIYIGAWAVGAVGLAAGTYFLFDTDEPDEAQTSVGAAPLPGGAALGLSGRF